MLIPNLYRSRQGFTLVELLLVIAILGILAAIAVPTYLGQRTKAARSEAMVNLESLRMLQEQYYAENGAYAGSAGTVTGNACDNDTNNTAAIQALLPVFKPGNQLLFSYCLEDGKKFDGTADADCYRAIATGDSGTSVADSSLLVDCNNDKNY